MKIKRFLAVLLTVMLMVGVIPFGAFTASAATSGFFTYTVSDGVATIIDFHSAVSGVANIPSTLGGYPVTRIGDSAFEGCSLLNGIIIPDGVKRIGYYAFRGCTSLTNITIPDSVTYIGADATENCSSLETVYFCGTQAQWNSVFIGLGNSRLTGAKLYLHKFGNWIEKTSASCVANGEEYRKCNICGDTETRVIAAMGHSYSGVVTAPTCTTQGYTTFTCDNCGDSYIANYVDVSEHDFVDNICTVCGETSNISYTVDGSVLTVKSSGKIGDFGSYYPVAEGYLEASGLQAPWYEDVSVLWGEEPFFEYTNIEIPQYDVIVKDGTTSIGAYFLDGTEYVAGMCWACDPNNFTDEYLDCSHEHRRAKFSSIIIPATVTEISENAFVECGNIVIKGYESSFAQEYAAQKGYEFVSLNCSHDYKSVVIAPTCTKHGYTKYSCYCGDKYIDNYVNATGHSYQNKVCANCGDVACDIEYVISDYVLTISGSGAMEDYIAPIMFEGLYVFDENSECWWGVQDYATGHTSPWCETIASNYPDETAFDVVIEKGITSIGAYAFDGTYYQGHCDVPCWDEWSGDPFADVGSTCGPFYQAYYDNITIPESVSYINENAFVNCGDITLIVYKNSYAETFAYEHGYSVIINGTHICEYEEEVTAPTCTENGYTTHTCANCGDSYIDNETVATGHSYENGVCTVCGDVYTTTEFKYTVSNAEVTITGYNGTATEVVIPKHIDAYLVTSIGVNAFSDCGLLTSITIPDSVTKIEDLAFCNCSSLTSVTIPDSVVSIYSWAFVGCSSLTSIIISNGVTNIGLGAFSDCSSLPSIIIPASVTSIGDSAFYDCSSLTSITIPASVTSIEGAAFYRCYLLETVYYCGTEEQWNNITIDSYNECLTDATRYYHNFSKWVITKPATCTESGEKQYTCSICGEVEPTVISATGHDYKSVVTAPTCSENGYTTHTCANCGDSYIDNEIAALGHSMVFVGMGCTPDKLYHGNDKGYQDSLYDPSIMDPSEPFVPPPEIHSAFEEYHCSVCGYVDYIYCDGETYTEIIEEPTCTEYGSKVEICIYCRSYIVSYQDIDPLGHSFGDWTTKTNATCTESGEKYRECSVCGHIETKAIPITDHDYKSVVTAPTCTEKGYTTHTCANCGDSYIDNETVATGHNYKTVITEPTCFEDGTEYNECTVCGHIETKVIPSIGHHVYKETVVAPTCTKQGCTIYNCVNCDDVYVDDFVAALGHSFGEWTTKTDATCTEDGEEYRECSVCGHTETQTIPATGHDYKSVVTAPTCTEKGFTTHTCANCGDSYTDTETAALGHDYKSVVTAPTCTENGYTTHTCANCGDSYIDSETDALGHNFGEWITKTDATCTENGEEYRVCSVCGHTETNVIPATGHNYESVVTAPNCTEKGYTTYTCTVCGDSYIDNYVNALGHSFGEWITETDATCTEDGEEYCVCSVCGHVETQSIPATEHNYESVVTLPTCTEKGFTTHTCTACDDSYTDTETAALGHNYESVVTAPTCTENGYTTHTCTACGDNYVDNYVNALSHSFGEWITKKENLVKVEKEVQTIINTAVKKIDDDYGIDISSLSGKTRKDNAIYDEIEKQREEFEKYAQTADTLADNYETAATKFENLGNFAQAETYRKMAADYRENANAIRTTGIGVLDTLESRIREVYRFGDDAAADPTCTDDGKEYRVCSVCGHIETQVIPATGHDYESVVTAPTCTEKGYTTHTCTACGDSYTDNDIAELGHNFGDWIITDCAKGEKHHVCSTCGHVETQVIPAMGHNYSDEFTVDKAPTETEDGSVSRHCSVCDSRTDVAVIPKGALDFGACGTSAVWVLGADNTLYIIGSGETAGYSLPTKSPWYKYREDITTVKIAQNITKIGSNSFSGLSNIGLVVVENPDMQFGAYVFKTDLALIMQCDVGGNVETYANENGYPIIGLDDLIPPTAPTVVDFANGVVTLEHKDGYEYSADGINWQSDNTFDNMPMDTVLCFYQRIAANGTNAASPASLAAKCIFVSAPNALVGENMIWIEPEEGYEYRLEDMDWVDSNEFIDYIISGERYTVFRRMKESSDIKTFYDESGTTVIVNGDNRIIDADSTDLAWIKKHLITTVNSNNLGADINEDGNVDIRDLVRLKKSLASIDVPSSPENTETQTINPKIGLKLNTSYYHVVDWDDGSCLSEFQFDGSELLCLAVYDTNKEYADPDDSIIYKGIEYYPIGFGGPLPEYTLTDEEIILKFGEEFSGDPDYDEEYRLVVTSTYDLLVTYSTGLMFNKGDILELNSIA